MVSSCDPVDIFMTAGTLQYMEATLPEILRSLKAIPENVLVHNLPLHSQIAFWTLQNLGVCEVPYKIHAQEEFKTAMENLGYELVASWTNPRQIEIPRHRTIRIEGYLGFYFRHKVTKIV
jgi:putative methyltransferase (TIGR04325 family)